MRRRALPRDSSGASGEDREATNAVSRPAPLTLVAGAVAGEDLAGVASAAARTLACPVAIAIPALGDPVLSPARSVQAGVLRAVAAHASAVTDGAESPVPGGTERRAPDVIAEAVAVRIADRVVGIVAALVDGTPVADDPPSAAERRAWLEAAAAAASVTAVLRDAHGNPERCDDPRLLAEWASAAPAGADLPVFLARARRQGAELGAGAIALSGRHPRADARLAAGGEPDAAAGALIGADGPGRLLALVGVEADGRADGCRVLVDRLREAGWSVAMSAVRRDPALLHQALREAELLAELHGAGASEADDETYRLLIGVLLRDRDELCRLHERTVAALADYDGRHDTELLTTLETFLTHDGSTTETAETMRLHRHTVGYRLSRIHEVSGLSPYASDGRERLGLGLKAQQILDAERRLARP